ncbi:MAG: galactokinase [Chitinophagaceae bacterium]|nr:galactokinase [Chitinophagaceae bacterium]
MQIIINDLKKQFQNHFEGEPIVVRSPGRVNLIGEHTDYNEGFVLPAAIDKAIYIAISARNNEDINLYSSEFNEAHKSNLAGVEPTKKGWPNYILGVVDQLLKHGFSLKGFNAVLNGDVPIGAGLSSSAAVECATVYALNELFRLNIPKIEMAKLAQKAEHEFAKVRVGIMDMFASMFGKRNHVIKLDCRSLEYVYEPLRMDRIKIVLFNTNVKHSLASSEYNVRRQQCEEGVALVKKHHPDVNSLRDITLEMLRKYVEPKDQIIYRRCKYVVEENLRLLSACEHLEQGNIEGLGRKMFESHEGLSNEYDVSCKELDFLVEYVRSDPAVLGARMMGGGFGGCTINLVREDGIDELVGSTRNAYEENMNLPLTAYIAQIEDGTSIITKT